MKSSVVGRHRELRDPAASDVLIASAGPTGLMLGGELGATGVATTLVERQSAPESKPTRAIAVQARTREIFDAGGLADELVGTGKKVDHFRVFRHVEVNAVEVELRCDVTHRRAA